MKIEQIRIQCNLALGQLPINAADKEASPYAKVKKWTFYILFRFFHRHGYSFFSPSQAPIQSLCAFRRARLSAEGSPWGSLWLFPR